MKIICSLCRREGEIPEDFNVDLKTKSVLCANCKNDFKNVIDEIPMDEIQVTVDKMHTIIAKYRSPVNKFWLIVGITLTIIQFFREIFIIQLANIQNPTMLFCSSLIIGLLAGASCSLAWPLLSNNRGIKILISILIYFIVGLLIPLSIRNFSNE